MASFSPSRSPGSARFQFGAGPLQRLKSSPLKKPPEPLRRAVADCLSSSTSSSASLHGNFSPVVSEAARTLRDYLAAPSTIDLAYSEILDHALAERERSPAVVARCVALLKRYLLRYVPSEHTLVQIDLFCVNSITECDSSMNRRVSPWSKSFSQHSGASTTGNAFPSLPASSFASGALVKSLNFVRSLVARHLPLRSFQPAVFAGASSASKQSLPTLSSLFSRSFNSQLNSTVASSRESPDMEEASNLYSSNLSDLKTADGREDTGYISVDAFKWRWFREQQSSLVVAERDGGTRPQDVSSHGFLEVGAAALLVGDMEAKMKIKRWTGAQDLPGIDKVLQPSIVTTATNVASAHSHLRAITASKRSKTGPQPVWEDTAVSTFRPRPRPLFHYRPYSEQQPLRLNAAEVCEVIAAVCSESSSPNANPMTVSSGLSPNTGKPSIDVAVSVLIKLVIDMYVLDSQTAAPLTLSMLEDMLSSPRLASKVRAFDLILNLGVHAHLLEPMLPDDPPTIEEECSQETYIDNEGQLATRAKKNTDPSKENRISSAIDNFECWLLSVLYEVLLLLVQVEEKEETVWASALSCLFYFVCDRGKIWRKRLEGLDIRVIKTLLEISREHSWAEAVHCKLICMLTNMFYQFPDASLKAVSSTPIFLVEQIDLLGGIEFICLEYSRANSMEEKRNLFLVLFDYVLYQINETCLATGGSEYSFDEIQPLAALLSRANAPEAFYIAAKHGVGGIGEILRGSISAALSRYPNSERLNMILEKIIKKFDNIIGTFTHLDDEFSHMIRVTKSYKCLKSIEDEVTETGIGMNVRLSWATLHSLLHSKRSADRQNGCIWLVELLIAEISEDKDTSVWSSIRNLQKQIGLAGTQDSIGSEVPLHIWIMCGLLKSKHNFIRWGFLFVLEKLLMRCRLLLDEKELEHSSSDELRGHDQGDFRLEKVNSIIDIMSSSLLLVYQINETDHINILKMCDMLFCQLCLTLIPANAMHIGNLKELSKVFGCTDGNRKLYGDTHVLHQGINYCRDEFLEEINSKSGSNAKPSLICDSESMAALLLRGQALVPLQLVARVPTALFFWPLIQLAGAATDDIALGVAVGSKRRGNLPGATSDIRAALLLLLIGKCTADPSAFVDVGREQFFRELLDDTDSRVAYYSSAFLLKRMMTEEPEKYQRMLQSLIFKAQQSNNEKLLENPVEDWVCLSWRGIAETALPSGSILVTYDAQNVKSLKIWLKSITYSKDVNVAAIGSKLGESSGFLPTHEELISNLKSVFFLEHHLLGCSGDSGSCIINFNRSLW
ncbi:hypothetical protein NE237_003072 [Protea cynaroides]|uniref:Uncharacterized protein n=1 Tax=Protea cynaroides TaxID=273540 RepID=A0A9Q0QS87_9MAGN|nr:hypothetical protein NE237_003072 [Protea cynaroides]